MEKKRILIVEDDKNIMSIIEKYLINEGYTVFTAKDGLQGLTVFNEETVDLVILDVMMPKLDGFQVLKEMRSVSNIPVLMLTAKKSVDDRIKGFDCGADDYVLKPFSPREVIKRVEAIIKRTYGMDQESTVITFNKLTLDTNLQQLKSSKGSIVLTSAEFDFLEVFFKNPNQVLSRGQLIEKAFGYDYDGYDRSIDTHIKRIRKKISEICEEDYIQTKYGAGYVLKVDRHED